jgi:acetyl-CoA carboxylase carboxyltransferase component
MNEKDVFADLERRAELGGGKDRVRRHHEAGKLTARERIDLLFDSGTVTEVPAVEGALVNANAVLVVIDC